MIQGVFTFKDRMGQEIHIYRSRNAYPVNVYELIRHAYCYAWPLPRFEPGDIAAGLVRHCKDSAIKGDVKILPSGSWMLVAPQESRYRYVVTHADPADTELTVQCFTVYWDDVSGHWCEREIFSGLLSLFGQWAVKERDST